MPLMKSKPNRLKKPARVVNSKRPGKSVPVTDRIGPGTIAVAVLCVMGAALLVGSYQPHRSKDMTSLDPQPERTLAQAGSPKTTAAPATVASKTATNESATDSATETPVRASAAVTITGCLERADEAFRLKDTSGADVPTSRSWKSGFLKKGPAPIDVVDGANRLRLWHHVGERVSLTGTLVDREMQVRSLQRVAASCTNGQRVKI
jgi:hypothetical protein